MIHIFTMFSWFSWTLILCFLMLSPSDGTVKNVSGFFGGTEITDAIGHVILLAIECILLYRVCTIFLSDRSSYRIAIVGTLCLGIVLELAQLWIPSRGTSLIDILAAGVGVLLASLLISKFNERATVINSPD